MPDNRLGDALSLLFRRPEFVFQEIEREEAAVEFKAEHSRVEVFVRGADIVKQAGEEVCLIAELPGGEVVVADCLAWENVRSLCRASLFVLTF